MGSISNGFKTVPNQNDFNFKLFQIKMISISNGLNFTAFQIKTISISNGCSKSNGFNFKCQKVSISGSLQDWTVRRPSGPVFFRMRSALFATKPRRPLRPGRRWFGRWYRFSLNPKPSPMTYRWVVNIMPGW